MSVGIRALPIPPNTKHAQVVYYIGSQSLGIVKIGVSANLNWIMRNIKANSPGVIEPKLLAWEYGDRGTLHARDDEFRRTSKITPDWYSITPELKKWIEHLRSDQPNFPEQI